jgi:CRISPR-associated protein Cas5d
MTHQVRIRGEYACITRPEFKSERVSYEVLTPSAARGILEAILWKPAIQWHIRRIMLLKPVRLIQFKRNEVNSRLSVRNASQAMKSGEPWDYYADEDRAQRNTVALRDVDFAIEAEMRMTSRRGLDDNPAKFDEMFRRRLQRGQCHMQPYLGCREFPCSFEPYTGDPPPIPESRDLGIMLHDLKFDSATNTPVFFIAELVNGVISVPEWPA